MRDRLPTITFLTIRRPNLDAHCPWCHYLETTIHILRDCPWAREVWSQSPGILPLSFFHQTLQEWLQHNATTVDVVLPHQLPWRIYFPFLCWNLWLSRNDRIFNHQSISQNSIIHYAVQMACEFHFLAGPVS